jgi:AP-1 complex subunit mu
VNVRYIVQEGHKLNRLGTKITNKPPLGATSSVAWRAEGLSYKKNEVFLDVIEKINLYVCNVSVFCYLLDPSYR